MSSNAVRKKKRSLHRLALMKYIFRVYTKYQRKGKFWYYDTPDIYSPYYWIQHNNVSVAINNDGSISELFVGSDYNGYDEDDDPTGYIGEQIADKTIDAFFEYLVAKSLGDHK